MGLEHWELRFKREWETWARGKRKREDVCNLCLVLLIWSKVMSKKFVGHGGKMMLFY